MSWDQALGAIIMVLSIAVIIAYAYFLLNYPIIVLEITALIAVVVLLGILAWIGFTLMTTPAPKPVEAPEEEKQGK